MDCTFRHGRMARFGCGYGALVFALSSSLGVAGCGDDGHDHDDHDHSSHNGVGEHDDGGSGHEEGHNTSCGLQKNCVDTVELDEGLEVEGEGGVFSVTIRSHNDLSVFENEWVVEVRDAEDELVDDATVTVQTYSVDCPGMHAGPSPDAEVTANADGYYEIEPDNGHGGPWDTVLEIEAGDATDTVVFPLCIPGEEHSGGGSSDAGS